MILNNQKDTIKELIINAINDQDIPIPNDMETEKVYNSVYYKYINRGCRDLRFKVLLNENKDLVIEYYFITDNSKM